MIDGRNAISPCTKLRPLFLYIAHQQLFQIMRTTHVAKMSLVLCRSCSRSLRLQAATRIIVRNYYTRPSCAGCLFAVGRRKGSSPWARYVHSRRLRRAFSAGVRGEGVWREEVIVMGIESSCDDTGVAVISGDGRVRGEAIHSQTDIHKEYVYTYT